MTMMTILTLSKITKIDNKIDKEYPRGEHRDEDNIKKTIKPKYIATVMLVYS